jgi:hypothetical protein
VRRRRALICLDTARFLTVYYASFSYGMFGYQTWPLVNSLKRDDNPVIVNAPQDRLYSYVGCHLALQCFISALLPDLSSKEALSTPWTSFRAVWETLPRVLNKYPHGSNVGKLEPHIRKSFLCLWAELGSLAGTGEAHPLRCCWVRP